ncbi:MAG: preprotein translocase subunit SecG [Waddliaceae bacterium]
MTAIYLFASIIFLILCAVLCFVVLIQESKSTGLGASFGGDSGESLFGTSTADVLKKFTGYLAIAFLICSLLLSFWTASLGRTRAPARLPEIEQG